MNKLTRLIFSTGCLLSLAVLVLIASCQSDSPQPTYQKEAVENALKKADSIPISGLSALAESLPGAAEHDSFFEAYIPNIYTRKGLDSLAAVLSIFEKLRGKEIFAQRRFKVQMQQPGGAARICIRTLLETRNRVICVACC